MSYVLQQHPTSGERYACEVRDGEIMRAAGPLHAADPIDQESLADWLDNSIGGEAEADAAWLVAELRRGWA